MSALGWCLALLGLVLVGAAGWRIYQHETMAAKEKRK
jgi:hypothetical protein